MLPFDNARVPTKHFIVPFRLPSISTRHIGLHLVITTHKPA